MKPQPPSHSHGELARPVTTPAAVFAAETQQIAPAVPLLRTELAKPAAANTLTATSILRALQRRQLLALGVAILAAGVSGTVAWYLVPPAKFKAQARLQVTAEPPKILFHTVETDTNQDYKRYQNTQQALVKSQLALNAALQDKEVSKCRTLREQVDPIGWLEQNLKVEFIAASELMEVSLSGEDPHELAAIVNAVTKAYIEEVVNRDIKTRTVRFDELKKLKLRYADMLKERRETLRKLARTAGSDDRQTLAYQQQIAMEHQARVRNELLDVQSQKRRLQARLKVKAQQSEEGRAETSAPSVSEADINKWIDRDPRIAKLTATLAQEEERLSQETGHVRSAARKPLADPFLRRIRQDRDATKKSLEDKRKALRADAIRALQEKDSSDQFVRDDAIEQELQILDDIERQLNGQIKAISDGNQNLTNNTLGLQELQDDVAQMQASALKVGAEVEALTVELGRAPESGRSRMPWLLAPGTRKSGSP